MKNLSQLANEVNTLLIDEISKIKNQKCVLLFSGGADSLWLWALMKKSNCEFDVIHSVPSDISNDNNLDLKYAKAFLEIEPSIKFLEYPILSKDLHVFNKKMNNHQPFRVFESHVIKNKLLLNYDLIIRGEDIRVHTPFLRKSCWNAYNRKIGLPYWSNKNRFRGEHILSSWWNALVGSNHKKKYVDKYGIELDIQNLSYVECHKKLCDSVYINQTEKEDRYLGSFYNERNVLYPFLSEKFKIWCNNNVEDICSHVKSLSLNEYRFQKILIMEALKILDIPNNYVKSKATLGVQKEMLSFLNLNSKSNYSNMSNEWIKYLEKLDD